MIRLESWLDIRTRHRNGETIREIARNTGFSKNTVEKYLRSDAPPQQSSPINRTPLMARFESEIDALLREAPTLRAPRVLTLLRERFDPTMDRPALFDGLLEACKSFGGVPREGVFDNASTAVKRVLRGRKRERNAEFAAFCGSLKLSVAFAAPAKGNEKSGVEGLHGYIEDNVFVPMLDADSLETINDTLTKFAGDDMARIVSAGETVAWRFEREAASLHPLPSILPSPCIREFVRINKVSEAAHKSNRYSVPTHHAHRDAIVECFAQHVRIVVAHEAVAEHPRCFGTHQSIDGGQLAIVVQPEKVRLTVWVPPRRVTVIDWARDKKSAKVHLRHPTWLLLRS